MAYRASTKRTSKKSTAEAHTAPESEAPQQTASELPVEAFTTPAPEPEQRSQTNDVQGDASVDQFVGGPVPTPEAPKTEQESTHPTDVAGFTMPPEGGEREQGGRGGYQPRGGRFSGGYRGNAGGGYRGNAGFRGNAGGGYRGNAGGYQNRYGGNRGRGGYQQGGYQGGYSNAGGYSQNQGGQGGYRRFERDFTWAPADSGEPQFTVDANVATETVKGILDMMPEGHGFLRPKFTPSEKDVYISQSQIRRFLLRNGDEVEGQARQPKENERYWGLLKVEKINGVVADTITTRAKFEDLVPIYPAVQIKLETGTQPLSTRIIDLLAPIGFGQRGLIVSPPKAGKTTILKEIAAGITANYPAVHLMAALIGERPEEVTDLTRSIQGEVLASNFDQSPAEQVRVAEIALDRAKRLVEQGMDVVVLLDSVTRLARAYNMVVNSSGRSLSGGFDPAALYPAKKFLGAARCIEAPAGSDKPTMGSLTVIGTTLVETGSRMDDLIYEELKGTGNMELHLSRKLQERRIFPAIDIPTSGTRHDELLLGEEKMKFVSTLRHMLTLLSEDEQSAMMIDRLSKSESNDVFLASLSKG